MTTNVDPGDLVAEQGETVTLVRVTNAVYNNHDELDEANSTIESVQVPAIFSQPSEEDRVRTEARVGTATLKATVESTLDVETRREGRRDRIVRDGRKYEVIDVVDDAHPFVDVEKKTIMLRELDGR